MRSNDLSIPCNRLIVTITVKPRAVAVLLLKTVAHLIVSFQPLFRFISFTRMNHTTEVADLVVVIGISASFVSAWVPATTTHYYLVA